MAPSKLSDADKQTILELYHLPEETTSTLAERYGVSNSTISRLLKSQLPEKEYALLIQQKRVGEKGSAPEVAPETQVPEPQAKDPSAKEPQAKEPPAKKVVEVQPEPAQEASPPEAQAETLPEIQPESTPEATPAPPVRRVLPPIVRDQAAAESAIPAPTKAVIRKNVDKQPPVDGPSADEPLTDKPSTAKPSVDKPSGDRRRRSRSRATDVQEPVADQLPLLQEVEAAPVASDPAATDPLEELNEPAPEAGEVVASSPVTTAVAGEDYDDDDDLDEDDDDLDEDDDFDGDDDGGLGSWKLAKGDTPNLQTLQISPLTTAALPGLCYVVVERTSSELVTCPLRDFSALGQVPEEEVDARTLPIFDNHRVARRFSRRNQRVVKVPDGTMLQKTSPYLQAKGITRLLIDGHIYALEGAAPLED
ncbi:MAG TPA: hypothetical protein V6D07_04615 [Trichocoleus sp.]